MSSRRILAVGTAAVAVLLTVGACSSPAGDDRAGQSTASAPSVTAASEAHNAADAMFAEQMIPHHEQAIEMADMVFGKPGMDPRVIDLAKQIKAAQGPEIQQMQSWLSQWGMPTMPNHGMMPGMSGMPDMDDTNGVGGGMMSDGDMTALQNAEGPEANKLFLSQMITHHQGAITMAQREIANGQYPAATAMARSIVTSQQQEIDTMTKLLVSL